MATIQTSLQLYDGMSSVLNNITSALNMTVSEFEALDNAADRDFNSASIESMRNHLNSANIELDRMQNEFREVDNAIQSSSSNADRFTNKIIGAAAAVATVQTAKEVLDLSDTYTNTTARLNMMNDGLQSTQELQDKIFASAERSRGAYQATADAVSKLGLMAGDAFNSNDEIIGFMEQINKQFTIAGTDTAGRAAAMLQLTQAMGSGVLRGEEFNSILEQAPNIIQTIAEYMNVPKGQLKDMAADGQITADVVKNAMFAAADETNAKFESMPKTFSQIWTSITNYAQRAFSPVLQRLNDIANSERFTRFMNAVVNAMSAIAKAALWVFELVMNIGNFIADNWSVIGPIVEGIATVLAILAGKWLIVTAATKIATQAQELFNAIASLNPVVLIIIGIIAAIYLLVAIINKVAGTSLSATGIIIGAFAATGADIANVFIGVYNFMEGIIIEIWNLYASLANFLGNVFNNPVKAVIRLFWDMFDFIAGIVQSVANMIDTILGTNLAGAISNFRTSLNSMVDGAIGKQTVYVQKYNQSDFQRDRIDPMQAFQNGYSFGENLANRFSNMFNMPDISDFDINSLGSITQNTANTDENTANIADKMSGLSADVEAIRGWAEKEAINQFTTAEIKVTMQNENRISSDMDLDGVINKFAEGISESMQMAAEGVYD